MGNNLSTKFFAQVLEELIPFQRMMGMKLESIEDGKAILRIPFKEEFLGDPRTRRWHGGVISAGMDAVGGAVGMTTLTSVEDKMSTIDIRVDYLSGSREEDLLFEGHIVRSGNRIIATRMTAYHPSSPNEPVAEGRAVYNVRRKVYGN